MSEYPDCIPGEQLIYSNVEAEYSATNRRGFQVWLVSRKIRDFQREIARRLEDFDWPSHDAEANRLTKRHCFFTLSNGLIVIAQTVPLLERDVLNRAGRFHAHAVVLTPENFQKIHCHPFAVWDHFPFQTTPQAAMEAELWKHDDPFQHAAIMVGPPIAASTSSAALTDEFLPLLARWLEEVDTKPIALPMLPEQVFELARGWMQHLPAPLRARLSLDTLSTGQALSTLHYRIAGGYDSTTLRDWATRKVYKYDPASGELNPPIEATPNAGLDHLAKCWNQEELSEADRTTSYQLYKALQRVNPGPLPATVSATALRLVSGAADIERGFQARVTERLQADLPFPKLLELVELPLREAIGRFSAQSLSLIRQPLPIWFLTEILHRNLKPIHLTEQQAAELEAWTSLHLGQTYPKDIHSKIRELFVMARRWGADRADKIRKLVLDPDWQDFCRPWLLRWLCDTSPTMTKLLQPEAADIVLDSLFHPEPDPRAIQDAEVLLGYAEDELPKLTQRKLRFVVAIHHELAVNLDEELQESEDRRPFVSWVLERLKGFGWGWDFRLGNVAGGQHCGVLLWPTKGPLTAGLTLLDTCLKDTWLRRQLLNWLVPTPPSGYEFVNPDSETLRNAEKAYERRNRVGMHDSFSLMTAAEFCFGVSRFLQDKTTILTEAFRTDHGVWLGQIAQSNNLHRDLFVETYDAIISAIESNPGMSSQFIYAALYGLRIR